MEMADSSPECAGTYNVRARKRKYFENDSDSSPIQCGQRNTKVQVKPRMIATGA
jgi:hypothetical protein